MKLTKKHWRELLDHYIAFALDRMLDKGEVQPMFILHTHDNQLMLMPAEWTDDEAKRMMVNTVRLIGIAHDAMAIGLITEAWARDVRKRDRETDEEHRTRTYAVPPSQAEDRFEVVMTTLSYRDDQGLCQTLSATAEIIRGNDGHPTGLKPTTVEEGSSGLMTDLLLPHRPPADIRAMAKDAMQAMGLEIELVTRTQ